MQERFLQSHWAGPALMVPFLLMAVAMLAHFLSDPQNLQNRPLGVAVLSAGAMLWTWVAAREVARHWAEE